MKSVPLLTVCLLSAALLAPAFSGAEEYLLYTPKPAAGDQVPASPKEGILVRTVTVKRGDTLKNLSRKHIGVASWFPQVLLFNSVKNPDLIHPGERLLFPVPKSQPAPAKKSHKVKSRHVQHQVSHRRHKAGVGSQSSPSRAAILDEQETYQRARRAYLDGDCRKGLELFDSFLRRFPNSNLAADVSLYRADCLLRLSAE
jgi:LysM repeat protein